MKKSWPALLEVVLLLPEEVDSRHLRLGVNRRHQVNPCHHIPVHFDLLALSI